MTESLPKIEHPDVPRESLEKDRERLENLYRRYSNLPRSIETGMAMRTLTYQQGAINRPDIITPEKLARVEEFNQALKEDVSAADISPDEIKRFSSRADGSDDDVQFRLRYFEKAEAVFQALRQRGFSEKEIIQ
ncbi:MAG TPA: hypothetical protein PK263_00810 [bacterium]|nr:hypothetical protein [bacterium]